MTLLQEMRQEIKQGLEARISLAPIADKYVLRGSIPYATWNRVVEKERNKIPELKTRNRKPRPGRTLTAIFRLLKIPNCGCPACKILAERMDDLGLEGCREHFWELSGILRDRAKKYKRADWIRAAKRAIVTGLAFRILWREPLSVLFRFAIERSRQSYKSHR